MSKFSIITLALIGFVGCGGKAYDGSQRFALSGKVSLDGVPVDGGTISFIPTAEKARPSGGDIVKGEYKVPEEKGANAGSYRVEIHWYKPTGKKVPDSDLGGTKDEVAEAVPAKYNSGSTETVEISSTKTNFDFSLTSK